MRDTLPHVAAGMIPLGTGQMAIDIGRRQFISTLGGAVLVWPLAAHGAGGHPRIGVLDSGSAGSDARVLSAFRDGLERLGKTQPNFATQSI
jgi:hypothetical protein